MRIYEFMLTLNQDYLLTFITETGRVNHINGWSIHALNKNSKEKGWIFFLTLKDMLILCKEEKNPYLIET